MCVQVENEQLKDYQGDYAEYLRKNETEATVMAQKAADQKQRDQDNIKAKSKAGPPAAY